MRIMLFLPLILLMSCNYKTNIISASIAYHIDTSGLADHYIRVKLVNYSDRDLLIPNFYGYLGLIKDGVDITDEYYSPGFSEDTPLYGIINTSLIKDWEFWGDNPVWYRSEMTRIKELALKEELKKAKIDSLTEELRLDYEMEILGFVGAVISAGDSTVQYVPIRELFKDGKPNAHYEIYLNFHQEPDAKRKRVIDYGDGSTLTFWPLKRIDNYHAYFGDIICSDTVYLNP